jgi:hypothetical protein
VVEKGSDHFVVVGDEEGLLATEEPALFLSIFARRLLRAADEANARNRSFCPQVSVGV